LSYSTRKSLRSGNNDFTQLGNSHHTASCRVHTSHLESESTFDLFRSTSSSNHSTVTLLAITPYGAHLAHGTATVRYCSRIEHSNSDIIFGGLITLITDGVGSATRNTEDLLIECRIEDVRSTRCIEWPEPVLSWAEN